MFQGFKQWWSNPYSSTMSAGKWVAFIGLIIVAMIIWKIILNNLTDWS